MSGWLLDTNVASELKEFVHTLVKLMLSMALWFLLAPFLSVQINAAEAIDRRKYCSENSKQLLDQAWAAQPQNVAENSNDPRKAELLYKQVLRDSPRCQLAMGLITSLLYRDHRYQQAYKYNVLLLKHFPNDPSGLQDKARLLSVWKKDHQGAIEILTKLLEIEGPGNGSTYYEIAEAYSLMNKLDSSLKFLKLAMSIDEGWGNSGNAQYEEGFANLRKDARFWELVKK